MTDDDMREFTRALFGKRKGTTTEAPAAKSGNTVPSEGSTPGRPSDPDHDMREFSRVLFGHTSTTHQITD